MKRFYLIFFLFLFSKFSISQGYNDWKKKYFAEINIGIEDPLFINNSFSKEMTNQYGSHAGFGVTRYIGSNKKFGIGISFFTYSHKRPNYQEVITDLLNENGVLAYGDIISNYGVEWRYGLPLYFSHKVTKKGLLSATLEVGIIDFTRTRRVFQFNTNEFVYSMSGHGKGAFLSGTLGFNYLLLKDYNIYLGAYYEMSYGTSPVDYEIRYGTGNNFENYNTYQYNDVFVSWRHALKFKLRTDFSLFQTR
jgi:hypothetical protein